MMANLNEHLKLLNVYFYDIIHWDLPHNKRTQNKKLFS